MAGRRHKPTRFLTPHPPLTTTTTSFLLAVIVLVVAELPSPSSAQDVVYNIPEEQRPQSFVGNVARSNNLQAQLSSEVFASLQYSLLAGSSSHGRDLFSVDPDTADVFTARRLDREALCRFSVECELDFKVGAVSGSYFKKINVKVFLNDVNDNAPRFNRSALAVDVLESVTVGATFSLEGAVDDDTGANNSVKEYILFPSDGPFGVAFTEKLDRTSDVTLVVRQPLDRETRSSYWLRLLAADGGVPQRTAEMDIEVNIVDNNDNAPEFSQPSYSATIGENVRPGQVIMRVSAEDRDEGANAEIRYRLSVHQDKSVAELFSVGAASGDIAVRRLPASGRYSVIVQAVDGGSPPKEEQVVVEVNVIDTTNNPPAVVVTLLNPSVFEDLALRSPVAHVSVEDPDSGRNGQVTCFSQSAFFDLRRLEEPDMMVELARPLDREDTPHYNVTLFCRDSGSPSLNATASFTVHVQDVNDNPPVFARKNVTISVPEGDRVGQIVYTATATDRDLGKNSETSYTSLNASADDAFYILEGSGSVVVARELDRETQSEYVLTVRAVDREKPEFSDTATVTVKIADVNDEVPVFSKTQYEFPIEEGKPAGSFVAAFNATDPDLGEGGRVSFYMGSAARTFASAMFLLGVNGTLVTKGTLDRETPSEVVFDVVAMDNGKPRLSSSQRVKVIVQDVNDNKPTFLFPGPSNRTLTLLIPVTKDAHLFKLNVIDADADGPNSRLTYALASANLSALFSVDAWTGDVWAKTGLGEDHLGLYNLTFRATDSGDRPLSSTSSLFLTVKLNPETMPIKSSDNNAVIAVSIVCATIFLAVVIGVVVFLVKRRDKGKELLYVNKPSSSSSNHTSVANNNNNNFKKNNSEKAKRSSSAVDPYLERQNNPSMFFTSTSNNGNLLDRSISPKLSIGFPIEPGQHRRASQDSRQWPCDTLLVLDKDEGDGGDLQTLNRVTSLRLQQAFEHISSIKSQLITGSDSGKPYEWREIHVPGRPEDFNTNSLSSRGTHNGDSINNDDDGVFLTIPTTSSSSSHNHHHHHHSPHNYHHHQHHTNNHHPQHKHRSSTQQYPPPPSLSLTPTKNRNGTRSLSQPASDNSHDSSQQSCSSLPNLYLKPGSDILVFRPTSATSCESSPSMDDNCTTTSGSYSITYEDPPGKGNEGLGADFNNVQDVYV